MKLLIVNADDFGAGTGINRGILEATRHGILTSASLMVNMPGTVEAASLARDSGLSVGLHVNLTNEGGPPVVPLDDEPACRREIFTQVERFHSLLGRIPTHIDSHHNVHRNPLLTPLFQEASRHWGAPLREHSGVRYFSSFYGQWDGETHAEHIGAENLARMLRAEIGEGCTELSCHPGYRSPDFQSTYSVERELELAALCAPVLREILRECGIQLTDYGKLLASAG